MNNKILLLTLVLFCFSANAKDNMHQVGVFVDNSVIHGKPAGFVGIGFGTNYNLNIHKYLSWGNELLYSHGFRLGFSPVEYGDAEIMVNYVKKDPISTNNIIFSSYMIGNLFNKNNNKLSVGFGLTMRGNFDKSEFYYGVEDIYYIEEEEIIVKNYVPEKRTVKNFGLGLITNVTYSYQVKDNITVNTEFGWRGFIGEINNRNYHDRASGSSILYLKLGCLFTVGK
jgi:hypothetical protein